MTIYAIPADMRGCLIPAIVAIEENNVTEEFCFICGRCTDHRGEHSDAQLLRVLDQMAGVESPDCFAEFGPHYGHDRCDQMLADMDATFYPIQDHGEYAFQGVL